MTSWHRISFLGAVSLLAWGQEMPSMPYIESLSATHNGWAVYGATNLTLRDEPEDRTLKLVKWDAGQWRTAMRAWDGGVAYKRIQENASGQVQIYTALLPCPGGALDCDFHDSVVYWRNRDTSTTWPLGYGIGGTSDNGEWAFTATDIPTLASGAPEIRRIRLSDGQTETVVDYSRLGRFPVRRLIADNGLIAMTQGTLLKIWRPDSPQPEQFPLDHAIESYVIDPAGKFLIAVGTDSGWRENETALQTLYRLDLDSRALIPLFQTPRGVAQPDLASDRRTVVFLSAEDWDGKNPQLVRQVWLADLESGTKRQLTTEPVDVKEVVLAGGGSAAYALTANLRLVRINLSAGVVEEIAPQYPRIWAIDPVSSVWAFGGRYWLWGRGFADAEILTGDLPVEVTARSGDDVEFLISPEAPTGKNLARVGAKGSPFQPMPIGAATAPVAPAFIGSAGRGITWLHEDGTAVTDERPANPGERVTARMTGMGPVDSSGNTVEAFQWSFVESFIVRGGTSYWRTEVPVLQSRAASSPGIYLVTIQLPTTTRFGFQYEGIEVALAGGNLRSVSRLPFHLP